MDQLLDNYSEWGFCIWKSFLSQEEVKEGNRDLTRIFNLLSEQNSDMLFWRTTLDGSLVPDRIDSILDHSGVLSEIVISPQLLSFLEQILNDKPIIFKDKVIFKRPGTIGYGLHQDYPYWAAQGFPTDKLTTVWFAFDNAGPESGTLEVFPGQHREILPGPRGSPLDTDQKYVNLESKVLIDLNPGDLFIFHPLLPHQSSPNMSERERKALFITYNAAEFKDQRKTYYLGISQLKKFFDHRYTT